MRYLGASFAPLLLFVTFSHTASLPLGVTEIRQSGKISLPGLLLSEGNNSSTTALSQNKSLGNGDDEFEYNIPNTSRYVSIAIERSTPINPVLFHRIITVARTRLLRHINQHGDSALLPADNPYVLTFQGCSSSTNSVTRDDGSLWLTYGILLETFDALKVVLDDKRRFYLAGYSTADDNGTRYGDGEISRGDLARGPAISLTA